MKKIVLLVALFAFSFNLFSQKINEIHYDNAGADTGEFIEVLLPPGADPDDFTVTLYNGSNGSIYGTHALSTFTAEDVDASGTYYTKLISGIQNGAPDGMALDENGTLIEFLSYEGTFTPTTGVAAGTTSTDIGVEETGTTLVGESLQRANDDSWFGPTDNTSGSPNEVALPVSFISFSGKAMDKQSIELEWTTASEEANDYFEIEYSTDGREFFAIDQIEGALNSNVINNYNYVHKDVEEGINYYRLRQVNTDGSFSFSPITAVRLTGKMEVNIFPTLAESEVTLAVSAELDKDAEIEVYNILGRLIRTDILERGATQMTLNVTNLQKGQYLVRIANGTDVHTSRFIKK